MNWGFIIGGSVGCIILAVLITKLYQSSESRKGQSKEELLEQCFGSPIYASDLSLAEVHAWVKSRDNLLTATSKAIVLKINYETLNVIGKKLDLDGSVDNMIIIAIVDESSKEIKASSLMKYEHIDAQLNEMLGEKGILVIEQ